VGVKIGLIMGWWSREVFRGSHLGLSIGKNLSRLIRCRGFKRKVVVL
jgi:hypothetical protein